MKDCLQNEPDERPSAKDIVNRLAGSQAIRRRQTHSWLTDASVFVVSVILWTVCIHRKGGYLLNAACTNAFFPCMMSFCIMTEGNMFVCLEKQTLMLSCQSGWLCDTVSVEGNRSFDIGAGPCPIAAAPSPGVAASAARSLQTGVLHCSVWHALIQGMRV